MRGFDPRTSFGPDVAASYDDQPRGDEDAAADLLAELAGRTASGRALELAIGTGRIAVPLTERGVVVDGIELSAAMVEVLEAKGCDLDVWVGDMAGVATGRSYGLVYLVYNTVFNLLTQDKQVSCFANAAAHLDEDGVFVVEAAVPSAWLPSHSYARPERVEADAVTLDVCTYDPVTQVLDENHVRIDAAGTHFGPVSCRLAWPSELDLMARIAGLCLVERWGGWQRQPYTGHDQHVSVYGWAGGSGPR
ncbi:class I SAM-dependent methyltransferase [Nocardioides sp. HDW12B]|uniref:class I SAM-dependent DNA methyltransferase n=1 Tax=Nocardioides sp. HDW12B TaxID=2714939 RepID=UPI00140E1A65|nr:class I SAM-dependent methyltransferase [Nocardioides sp. HDW12B]QIK66686.1 class I SAM-dependent methyltransferase [Nocardioides sp. HDW12B]